MPFFLMNDSEHSILVVEDEPDIQELLHYNFTKEGFRVFLASDGEEGLSLVSSLEPSLIILDIMLPKLSGFEVCKRLREQEKTSTIPIIIVTAKSEEHDTIFGLDLGADDYVVKPFSIEELIARVRVHLRRYDLYRSAMVNQQPYDEFIRLGPLALASKRHIIFFHNKPLILTLSEFKILATMMSSPGTVFSRAELIKAITDDSHVHLIARNIDVHVLSIRKKLKDHAHLIQTIRGVGYKCVDQRV
ncbi:MAG: response regulator transcription factor [Proteobacteria bacterium]|nr:response regulator transcription factor [Pseudomonadota bacterium]